MISSLASGEKMVALVLTGHEGVLSVVGSHTLGVAEVGLGEVEVPQASVQQVAWHHLSLASEELDACGGGQDGRQSEQSEWAYAVEG